MPDPAAWAELVASGSAFVLGGIGAWRTRKRDKAEETVEGASVARKDFDAVVEGWRGIAQQLQHDVQDMRTELTSVKARLDDRDHEVSLLRDEVDNCERDKAHLARRVKQLEDSR